jgi:mannose-1-phosphate guanylyltransferase/phosphomannomutase
MMGMIKQAVLLCGGEGTRLRPYTYTMSKQMIPILGKPLTEWNIVQFKKHGVTEFLINLYTKPEVMRNYLGDGSQWGVKITYNLETTPPGTAGSIKQFENKLNDEFFVIYGDTLSLLNYSNIEKMWREKPKDAVAFQRVQKMEDYKDADVAELGDDGKFLAIHPKPHMEIYANAYRMRGGLIMKKKIIEKYVPKERYYEIGRDLLPEALRRGEAIYGYECDDYSKGIDTIEKWHEVESYLKDNDITYENFARS